MQSTDPAAPTGGFVLPGFEPVAEQFRRNFQERGEGGAAFAAVVDGRPAVDLWGGLADRERRRSWRRDTLAGLFSGTKGLVATCLLLLVERGALDLERPVHAYWPEFAAHGKSEILVRHLVSHHAGLPGLTTPVTPEEATDGVRMAGLLADQPAVWPPGTRLYYHAMTFGWLCGELVRRIDGRSVGRFFRDEVARPLGLGAWIGLPAEHDARVAVLERGAGFGTQRRDEDAARGGDPLAWSIWDNPSRFATDPLPANLRYWRAAEVPGSNGTASARSLARLYGCLARGGAIDSVRLLRPQTIELGATCLARGAEPYVEETMAFGVGFQLQTEAVRFGPVAVAFGHTGTGGSVHGAWPASKVGFSYLTSVLREARGADPRAVALLEALHDALRANAA
ncbi:MAG TPA: serine hydrolase domain-containing protein [Solirubrobacteraceae bacterium]|nr:serine hydrolase domain-containing protein [Solirubrobacteraceae bacterium]